MNRKLLHRQAELERMKRQRLLALFGSADGEQVLAELEQRFETHLPVFQGKPGAYDPLDAMRRDAHREVFLVIRRLLELARSEVTQHHNPDQDDE